MESHPPVPYPAISGHGLIGDRRTAALVAADGTLDWLCLPDYDGAVFCGALLDVERGGYWHFGPAVRALGRQAYRPQTVSLQTSWDFGGSRLELIDLFASPQDDRTAGEEDRRVVLRRLRCLEGIATCELSLAPTWNFSPARAEADSPQSAVLHAGPTAMRLWTSRRIYSHKRGVQAEFTLRNGEECWAVLTYGTKREEWSVGRAQEVLEQTEAYWQEWDRRLSYHGQQEDQVRLSGRLVHLLTFAPAGSIVAAPTTSLPERIGGDWNCDYRLSWVRDASLALTTLTRLGNPADARRFLEWLCTLDSTTSSPLQVVYGIRGETKLLQREIPDLDGYRGSRPVRIGNHAYQQLQHDALGYLLDCIWDYFEAGGEWHGEFWELVRRVADHLGKAWRQPDNGIWELSKREQFLSGRVMSWVALDRAARLAEKLGHSQEAERWRAASEEVRTAVLQKGWSERAGAFGQRFGSDNLDAAALLIPIMGFLPPDDPRVVATIERIAQRLTIDGFVYRFDPKQTPGFSPSAPPLGHFEGAFLPCTFWLATAYALRHQPDKAEAILERAQAVAGQPGLFAEAVDPRNRTFLGNTPLLFSQTEFVQAVHVLSRMHATDPS